tara:strand:+ start:953 stop:2728 length:1776 start_codon:yes stop_codon:yes gene_type:complete
MAELAIPLLALGGFYIIANKNNKDHDECVNNKTTEGFMNKPTINYPLVEPVNKSNVKHYPSANQTTDKFFDGRVSETISRKNPKESVGGGNVPQMSLTGNPIEGSEFKHNNMVPFYSAKSNGASVSSDIAEMRLDNMQGSGSQAFKKKEQAPLFKPQTNMQHAHGAPNMSDFLQSRVNPSMRFANTKPWEEQRIAPGLGKGYNAEGGIGFNSGMEARDSWQPKTVDQLRIASNPKQSYGLAGHEGPANSMVKEAGNIQTQGRVEKYSQDTCYTVGPSRWNTTTGIEKAPTARGVEVFRDVNRPDTTEEYYGGGAVQDGQASYAKGTYQTSRRPELEATGVTNVSAAGKRGAGQNDYGLQGFVPLPTNRSTMKQPDGFGAVRGLAHAAIAPILDVLRPSRKENTIGNIRANGNAGTTVSNVRVHNPGDRTKTTLRETTEGAIDCNYLNYQGRTIDGYSVSEHQPTNVQRDTTNVQYTGSAGPSAQKANQTYDAAYRQRNNVNKTHENRPNHGGTQMFNQQENIRIGRVDADRNNNRMYVPGVGTSVIPSAHTLGATKVSHGYDTTLNDDRMNPDILTAFKQNPYTQSLQSVA